MAQKPKSKSRLESQDITGISAAAIEGAEKANPNIPADKPAQPGPGLTDRPTVRRSDVAETQDDLALEDEEQEWRRAGGGGPDDKDVER